MSEDRSLDSDGRYPILDLGTIAVYTKQAASVFTNLPENKRKLLRGLWRELAARRLSPLELYEPTEKQLAAHKSQAIEKLILGSNRSAKTTTAAFEVAMAVTGRHPYVDYPKKDGRCVCVALDGMAIGEVMFRKLFRRGTIRMFYDVRKMQYRPWRPWTDGYDPTKTKPSFPLIDHRMIKSITWEDKGLDFAKKVTLKNGWELTFYTSNGKPPQGIDIDLCLAGWSQVYDPVAKVHRRIDQISGPWHVWSYNTNTRRVEIQTASEPFIKGIGEIIKVSLSNGKTIHATRRHKVYGMDGDWISIQEAFDRQLPLSGLADVSRFCEVEPESHPSFSPVFIEEIESCGELSIWDISVTENHCFFSEEVIHHNCWFSEEVKRDEWYTEMAARLVDRGGRFIWDATPQAATDMLWELHERAQDNVGLEHPSIQEFKYLIDDNPYISPKDKQILKDKYMQNQDQYRVRIMGEFLVQSKRVYPNFSVTQHGCEHFEIPDHWTRYIVVDPGFTRICALFIAVPPPKENPHIYIYDELYLERSDAKTFARKLQEHMGPYQFEAFLIDAHGSRRTEVNGKSIRMQYAEELEAVNVKSNRTGSDFIPIGGQPGHAFNDSINDSVDQCRAWLWDRGEGLGPKLQYFRDRCQMFKSDMTRYQYGSQKSQVGALKPDRRKYCEGPDCFRYTVLYDPQWIQPRKRVHKSPVQKRIEAKQKSKRKGKFINLGSGN